MRIQVRGLIKGDVVVAGYEEFDLSGDVPFTVTTVELTGKYSEEYRVGLHNDTATVALYLMGDQEVEI